MAFVTVTLPKGVGRNLRPGQIVTLDPRPGWLKRLWMSLRGEPYKPRVAVVIAVEGDVATVHVEES